MRRQTQKAFLAVTLLFAVVGCTASNKSMSTGSSETQVATKPGIIAIPKADRVAIGSFSGTTLNGESYSLSNSPNLTVINVWASWCTNCRLEWKDLQTAAQKFPEVKFLGLNTSDKKTSALAFVKKQGDNYPHIFDPDLFVFGSMRGVSSASLPMTLILDGEQKLAVQMLGKVEISELSKQLKALKVES